MRLIGFLLAALILLFGLRCYMAFRVFNDTTDETAQIACGLEILETHRYALEYQHPPLARLVVALPAYWAGLRQGEEQRRKDHHTLWATSGQEFYWHTLSMA